MSPDLANTILKWLNVSFVILVVILLSYDMFNNLFGCAGTWRMAVFMQMLLDNDNHMAAAVTKKDRVIINAMHHLLTALIFGSREIISCDKVWQSGLLTLACQFTMFVGACHEKNGNRIVRVFEGLSTAAVVAISIIGAGSIINEIGDYTILDMTSLLFVWAVNLVISVVYFMENGYHSRDINGAEIKKTQ